MHGSAVTALTDAGEVSHKTSLKPSPALQLTGSCDGVHRAMFIYLLGLAQGAVMESSYRYHASAQWHQHDRSFVELEHGAPRIVHFSAPPEFGGEAGVWTPEHFLLAAVASCFIASFRAVAAASRLEFQGIEVSVDGLLEKDTGGFRFTTITLHPVVIVFANDDSELASRLVEKAERICLVTRSLSSRIEVEPKILSEEPAEV
jgi:peroxiredoxin-like protein